MFPERRDRQRIQLACAAVAFALSEDGQDDGRNRAGQRAREKGILPGVGRAGEVHIERHRPGAGAMQLVDDAGIVLARPGPAPDRRHARRVHFDDVQLAACGVLAHGEACVLQRVLERPHCARDGQ